MVLVAKFCVTFGRKEALMSRIGKKPIALPSKVEVKIEKSTVTVKGPKGQLTETFSPDMTIKMEDGMIVIDRPTDLSHHKALHGLTRALLSNMVQGVSEGFRKTLRIEGVGYQASLEGKNLQLKLGHSHDVVVEPPENITFDVPKETRGTVIHIDGIDKQVVGQVAANVRGWRPPEPYKGKGVRYEGELIRRKAGKSGKK
jgi:large subunit ribosomal protein L6